MSKTMLIDAAHPEETRVVVLKGTRVEEFDFESRARKQLRGNIYLAKVTRVEPSLQAAFIEYGGNRHGFLAFNEIHPDYYQIPHADREALMREAEQDDEPHEVHDSHDAAPVAEEPDSGVEMLESIDHAEPVGGGDDEDERDEQVERLRRRLMRRYKIQEVIKRKQIMLVQVVKEERGNKGAALTTYMSLAGRYCVLMPNTDRGGGISRKITTGSDRKRLRDIVNELDVPQGMGLIVRTAGAKRTRAEITRDYDYLARAWSTIRDTTMHSIAPALIYEEEDLVKRAIRDLFDKDVESIQVEGATGFREARTFMRMLMPSQAKKIQLYRGGPPLFMANRVEDHLAQIYSPIVPLRSGGYLVINQTEALVAVDVNSGRATRERNIEATALKTNLEAAEETCRQLRLRDLAGLVVIDFIDMDEGKNNRAVERVMKECLAVDRARIQMGRISAFGLMEISRQRRRSGILEGTTLVCPHCNGAGRIRSVESSALAALRAVEMEAMAGGGEIVLRVPRDVSLYILNHKREYLTRILHSHGLFVSVVIDESLSHAEHAIDRVSTVVHTPDPAWQARMLADQAVEDEDDYVADEEDDIEEFVASDEDEIEPVEAGSARAYDDEDDDEDDCEVDAPATVESEDGGRKRGRRRRRGRRSEEAPRAAEPAPAAAPRVAEEEGDAGHRRRRGRRGGRRPRDEAVATDVYAWSWPARLSGDDPYEWRGPVERPEFIEASEAAVATVAPEAEMTSDHLGLAEVVIAPPLEPSAESTFSDSEEVWVELDTPEPKPARARRSRGRGRGAKDDSAVAADASVETVPAVGIEAPVELTAEAPASLSPEVAEPLAAKAHHDQVEAVEAAPVAEPAAEPVMVEPALAEPIPAPEPVFDPAEISAPAAAPKRGWWRGRG